MMMSIHAIMSSERDLWCAHSRKLLTAATSSNNTTGSTQTKEHSLRAQQLLTLASEVLFDDERATQYMECGYPDYGGEHDCDEQVVAIDSFWTQLDLDERKKKEARNKARQQTSRNKENENTAAPASSPSNQTKSKDTGAPVRSSICSILQESLDETLGNNNGDKDDDETIIVDDDQEEEPTNSDPTVSAPSPSPTSPPPPTTEPESPSP